MELKHLTWAILLVLPGLSPAQTFVDVTEMSGTDNRGLYSTGVAWGDYDSDGDLDLYVTNWGTAVSVPANVLYRNEGDGTFSNVAGDLGVELRTGNSSAVAWGDYDNDGDLDLYVANFYEQDHLYENQESSFVEVGRSRGMVNLVRLGGVTSVAWGDYDNDGLLDIYLGKFYYDNELYQNNRDDSGLFFFQPVTDLGIGDRRDTQGVNWVDYDSDGDLDLYVVNREQENALYRNEQIPTGRSGFLEVACPLGVGNTEIGQSGTWGDYDNDGDLDLFLANVGANALYRNEGADRFVDVAEEAGVRLDTGGWITAMAVWIDYDGDGHLDLFLANGGDRKEQRDVLYASNSDGTFRNATADLPPTGIANTAHMAVAWGDYDDNRTPDFYLTNGWGLGNRLYENSTPGSRFIRVLIRGKGGENGGSVRDGTGAQVSLIDGTEQLRGYRQVLAGTNSTGLIFGVPEGPGPFRLEVRFPSGVESSTDIDLTGSRLVTIVEP